METRRQPKLWVMLSEQRGYAPPPQKNCVLSIIFLGDHWPPAAGVCSTGQFSLSAPPVASVNSRTLCTLKETQWPVFVLFLSLCLHMIYRNPFKISKCCECWGESEKSAGFQQQLFVHRTLGRTWKCCSDGLSNVNRRWNVDCIKKRNIYRLCRSAI